MSRSRSTTLHSRASSSIMPGGNTEVNSVLTASGESFVLDSLSPSLPRGIIGSIRTTSRDSVAYPNTNAQQTLSDRCRISCRDIDSVDDRPLLRRSGFCVPDLIEDTGKAVQIVSRFQPPKWYYAVYNYVCLLPAARRKCI